MFSVSLEAFKKSLMWFYMIVLDTSEMTAVTSTVRHFHLFFPVSQYGFGRVIKRHIF